MEQQKLPNVTIALVLSILSFLCCCFGGVPGLIMATIAFFLVRGDEKKLMQNHPTTGLTEHCYITKHKTRKQHKPVGSQQHNSHKNQTSQLLFQ